MAASSILASNLIASNPKSLNLSHSILLFSKPLSNLSFSLSSVAPVKLAKGRGLELGFVRKVASVSSDYEQDELEEGEEDEVFGGDEVSFSPELKLYVGNLPFTVDSGDLAGLFGNAGAVEMVEVIYDKLSGRSRGFGFVTMSTVEEVEAAAQQFNGYEYKGRTLRVNLASSSPPPREERPSRGGFQGNRDERPSRGGFQSSRDERPSRDGFQSRGGGGGGSYDSASRLYVGNLSWGVDNAALETLFSEQGEVTDAKVVYDRDSGRSRGFGFVTYRTVEEANNAISSLDGSDLDGRTIRVNMAEARPPRREF